MYANDIDFIRSDDVKEYLVSEKNLFESWDDNHSDTIEEIKVFYNDEANYKVGEKIIKSIDFEDKASLRAADIRNYAIVRKTIKIADPYRVDYGTILECSYLIIHDDGLSKKDGLLCLLNHVSKDDEDDEE